MSNDKTPPLYGLGLLAMARANALQPQPRGLLSMTRENALASLLSPSPPSPPRNALSLSEIANALYGTPGPQLSAGGSQIGNVFAPARPRTSTLLSDAMAAASKKRRVFFSFHYQLDINRVNIVRQSWRFRPEDGTQPADWFDHSIWESAKKTGETALKRLIHGGMERSSVTCVLAGAETWRRPWVRYEIAYGLARGNGLMTVFIDGLKCMKNGLCGRGPNPLDYLGLKWDGQGKAHIWENFGGQWRPYPLYTEAVTWPKWLPNVTEVRFIRPLSQGSVSYDYIAHNGYANLSSWADTAAQRAGR